MVTALVIDDNRQTADALIQMLKLWDIEAISALNTNYALELLKGDIPDVIFLDLHMPDLNGFEVLAYLNREPRLSDIPVLIITADDQPDTAKQAIQSGASAVVIKPVMPDTIESALKRTGLLQ